MEVSSSAQAASVRWRTSRKITKLDRDIRDVLRNHMATLVEQIFWKVAVAIHDGHGPAAGHADDSRIQAASEITDDLRECCARSPNLEMRHQARVTHACLRLIDAYEGASIGGTADPFYALWRKDDDNEIRRAVAAGGRQCGRPCDQKTGAATRISAHDAHVRT